MITFLPRRYDTRTCMLNNKEDHRTHPFPIRGTVVEGNRNRHRHGLLNNIVINYCTVSASVSICIFMDRACHYYCIVTCSS